MPLTDDVERLTAVMVRQHQRGGLAAQIRRESQLEASEIAKACGTSPDVVRAWEDGRAQPTTHEALAWLHLMYSQQRTPAQLRDSTA